LGHSAIGEKKKCVPYSDQIEEHKTRIGGDAEKKIFRPLQTV